MAQEIQAFEVDIPAGTLKTAPRTFQLTMPPRTIDEVEILVPPGPRGNVGFQLALAGTQIIPYTAGAFLVSDDEVIRWPLQGYPDSGAWELIAYNLGQFQHSLYLRFLVELPALAPLALLTPLPASVLSSGS